MLDGEKIKSKNISIFNRNTLIHYISGALDAENSKLNDDSSNSRNSIALKRV